MSDIAISVVDLGKQYVISAHKGASKNFREVIGDTVSEPFRRIRNVVRGQAATGDRETFWALRAVNFEVKQGEVIGVIGRNGAGKSTLLKILSQITEPTTGYANIYGRVGALLEAGTGFHPELTGRENIYLNGSILGMSRFEIDRKFEEIVDFAGVEKFIETPVKHYSSGMGLRLGFAVAAHLEPDILIVDEVLAVGDSEFQRKCLGKMEDVSRSGRTVLFVSHNMAAIRALCSRCLLLSSGHFEFDGDTDTTITHYLSQTQVNLESDLIGSEVPREGSGVVRFNTIRILNRHNEPISVLTTGEDVVFELDYQQMQTDVKIGTLFFFIHFNTLLGERLFACSSRYAYNGKMPPLSGSMRCVVPALSLVPGMYSMDITCKVDKELYDHMTSIKSIQVTEGDYYGTGKIPPSTSGHMLVKQDWTFTAAG